MTLSLLLRIKEYGSFSLDIYYINTNKVFYYLDTPFKSQIELTMLVNPFYLSYFIVTLVTPTDRPKSVRNRCVIELFVALFVLSLCPFDIGVCHRTESDLFLIVYIKGIYRHSHQSITSYVDKAIDL